VKIVLYDVESKPNTCYTWGLFNQNLSIDKIKEPQAIISWAAKDLGSRSVLYADDTIGHEKMIRQLHKVLSEADAVCTYNGQSFDNKMLNAELVRLGLKPLPPTKQIDLYKTVKKHFRFPSNKLDYVAQALGIGEKVKHEGFGLWVRCMENDPKAWKQLKTYNIGDVKLLEKLYYKLQGWIPNHPSHSLEREDHVCPNCASKRLQQRGYATTKLAKYKRFQCLDCGSWSRGRISEVEEKDKVVVGF
jgi:hypothetical protein